MVYTEKHKLSDDLRHRCPKLFSEHRAQVAEERNDPGGRGGYAYVVMLIDNMWFRFVAEEGLLYMYIRDIRGHAGWELLDKVIVRLTGRDTKVVPLTWEQWCELFLVHYQLLKKAKGALAHQELPERARGPLRRPGNAL